MSGNLPQADADWVSGQLDGELTLAERHVARREAWKVRVRREDGTSRGGFFRVERHPPAPESTVSLEREARICLALADSSVPVPRLLAWDAASRRALFEWVPGSAAIDKLDDARQQRAVMEDFIDAVARLHQLEQAPLKLESVLGTTDIGPRNCALDDLEAQLRQFDGFLKHYRDPLMQYGIQWLRRFAPEKVARVSLVQGDTGPVNFMFDANHVTAIVDWEWGHWGDPMEDLGNICVREFWNPSGGLSGLFHRYAKASGIPYDPVAVRYYRVQQNIRGMIGIHAACAYPGGGESLAWYLAYRYVGDRATCEAMAEAMKIPLSVPDFPDEGRDGDGLVKAALSTLEQDVAPDLSSDFARSRLRDTAILMECADRRRRYGETLADIERREIGHLLGAQASDPLAALCDAINEGQLADEPLLQYLARRAYRDEWLHEPVTRLYPDRRWSPIDP